MSLDSELESSRAIYTGRVTESRIKHHGTASAPSKGCAEKLRWGVCGR